MQFNVRWESSNEWWIEKGVKGSLYCLSVRTVRVSGEMLRFLPFLSSRSAQRFTAIWTILLSGSTIRNPVMLVPPCWYGSKSIVCRSWKQTTCLSFNPCHRTGLPDLWFYSVPTAFIYPYKFSNKTGHSRFFFIKCELLSIIISTWHAVRNNYECNSEREGQTAAACPTRQAICYFSVQPHTTHQKSDPNPRVALVNFLQWG
jgi:hypothetical protein